MFFFFFFFFLVFCRLKFPRICSSQMVDFLSGLRLPLLLQASLISLSILFSILFLSPCFAIFNADESSYDFFSWYVVPLISFQTFLYRYLKLSQTLENSVWYCYTYYEMTDQFLWFLIQINSYSSSWNTPY